MLRTPSGLPRPRSLSGDIPPISDCIANDLARKRQAKKDETIRKKLEQELIRQTGKKIETRPVSRTAGGTVGSLRPTPAILLPETATASEAARHMAVKRADAVLILDEEGALTGIVTDKDLAFRVLAEGYDPRSTHLGDIMTRDPCTVTTSHSATDALNKMVAGGFRHLPVIDNVSEDMGMLDITECLLDALAKLERAHKSTKQLSDVLDKMSDFDAAHNKEVAVYVRALQEQLGFPKLESILDPSKSFSEISIKTNVRDAARVMRDSHQTAALVLDEGKAVGIFTSKDIVVRVMAMGLDPTITSTVRVMTPTPDMVSPDTTILDALRKMHGGHYQHLPLLGHNNTVVGIVDILQLTYTTLNTLKSMQSQEGEGPVWNKFWNAVTMEENASSGSVSENHLTINGSGDNQSGRNLSSDNTSPSSTIDGPFGSSRRPSSAPTSKVDSDMFTFKFTDTNSSQTHRFHAPCKELEDLSCVIRSKMSLDGDCDISVSYIDDENDKIALTTDEDLQTAISTARKSRSPLIRLVVESKPSPEDAILPKSPFAVTTVPHSSRSTSVLEYLVVSGGSFGIGFSIGAAVMWALLRSK